MADPLERFRVGVPESAQEPVAPDADPLGRFRVADNTPAIPVAPTSLNQEFSLGMSRGGRNFNAMLGGLTALVGREAGIESLQLAGENFAAEQSELAGSSTREGEIDRFSEVEDAGGFFKWAASAMGEAIPSLASAAGGGGLGGIAGKKLLENRLKSTLAGRVQRQLVKKGATQEEAAATARRLINSDDGQRWLADSVFRGRTTQEITQEGLAGGAKAGLFAVSAGPQIGAVDLELQSQGIDAPMTALIAGAAGGALEALPMIRLMERMFPGVDTQLSKQFVRDFAAATGTQAAIEGGTEAAQEMIQLAALAYHDPSFDPWSPEARTRVMDAFAAGALVGAVTGGAAEGAGQLTTAIRQGAVKKPPLPSLPNFEFRPPEQESYPDGFEPADNTVFEEIRGRVYSTVGPKIEAAVNSAKAKIDPVLNAINTELNPGMNREGVRLFDVVKDAHESFISDHREMIGQVQTYLSNQTRRIYEAAAAIRDPAQREAYIEKEVEAVRKKTASFVDNLRRRAQARDQDLEAEIDNLEFDDDLELVDDPNNPEDLSRPEPGDVEPQPVLIFGKNQKRPQTDVSGRETVQGYDSREQARLGLETLLNELPEATEEDFDIRQQDDGTFVIESPNPDLRADLDFNDAIRKAISVANQKKRTGNFRIGEEQWKGNLRQVKSPTVNLTQLAWEGMKLVDQQETRPTLYQAFQASVAKMLDRGMIDGDTAQAMLDQFVEENPDAVRGPDAEVYAPVTNYPSRNAAVAAMLKIRDRIRDQFDLEWGWPKNMVDVQENSDGTWSWGVTGKGMFKRLRAKNPEQAQAILGAIRQERRSEKLAAEPIGPGGRDIGVSADVRGTFAGVPDTTGRPVVRDSQSPGGQRETVRGGNIAPVIDADTGLPTGQTRVEFDPVESRESKQSTDKKTNPEELPSEFEARNRRDDPALGKVDRSRKPDTSKLDESQKRILDRLKRPAKTRVLIGMEFDKEGAMTKAIGELANFVRTTLGLENSVIVMDDTGLKLAIESGWVSDPVFEQTLSDPSVHARNIRIGDNSYIYLSQKVLSDPNLTTLALGHEMGHQLYSVAWDNLTEQAQKNLRKASKAKTDEEFNEWMADQLAAWIVNRRLPRNAVEKFFFTVGSKIRQLYDFLKGNKRFQLNQTFSDFADAVAERATRTGDVGANPASDARMQTWFKNEGVVMRKWFGIPTKDDMGLPLDQRQLTQNVKDAIKRVETNYPVIAKRAATLSNWMTKAYKIAIAPSTSVMKSLGKSVPVAKEVVKIFGRQDYGTAKKSSNYHQRVNLMRGQFLSRYGKLRRDLEQKVLSANPGMSNRAVSKAVDRYFAGLGAKLRAKEGNPNATFTREEKVIREMFDDMHRYARAAGLPVGKIVNYFPRQFDRAKLIDNKDKIINHLTGTLNMSQHEARSFYNSLIDPTALDGRATSDAVETPSFKNMNSRTARDKFFDQFLDDNVDGIISNYINAVVKRAEFNRVLGEPMPPTDLSPKEAIKQGLWDPKGKYHKILRQAKREGATDEQLQTIEKYIDANLGQLGRDDISSGTRKWMAGVMAYQNMRVLLFTVFASLPDMVGPAIRSGSLKQSFKAMKENMAAIAKNDSDLAEMARAYGIISDAASEHIMTEYVDNHYMHPTLRKWNDNYFKWTGLNWYTNFTRKAALAVGIDYIQNMAQQARSSDEKTRFRAQAALKELGINARQVELWVAAGKPTYESLVDDSRQYPTKVAEALVQFVDESIMRPNPAQRPILASHPALMLVYHLKGYLYAVSDVVVGRLWHNIQEAQGVPNTLAAMAPAIAMMALTAVGLELRELIQYAGSNRTPRTDRMDGWEYITELVERSGLTGYAQLAIDFEGMDDRGMSEVAGMGGPAASQLGDWLSRPATQNIPKAIPVIGQLQGGRDAVRAIM